jgi:excisionase family DNA binding protein
LKILEESLTISTLMPYEVLTITQAAEKLGKKRQSIYAMIRQNKIKAYQINRYWFISPEALNSYLENRYSRENSKINGVLVHDNEKGEYSVKQTAKIMKRTTNHIHYLIKAGYLRAKKKGAHPVIMMEEIQKYMNQMQEMYKIS